ncbi:beta-phosphoglucomutase family hydrolase [Nitrospira moscoviensis]|uniref:Beta-phosphoglucomutase n=1 Tax=Nitrospira moscoviensis TaxID=42253 RepID=A0A0K2GBU3_NITMO|nr:beta-phosphoglucomutase family hydrolase [Nitrospira moscoviensis]ALA58421.1 putative Beta-phosphoglucomutase hydrolase [Nitrospira moscoviensis]
MTGAAEWSRFTAALFDMDGVLTRTACLHAQAWKWLFDDFLRRRAGAAAFRPFDEQDDYRRYVDGRLREDGVRAFLASRGVVLPAGGAGDPPDAETVAGLAARKETYFSALLDERGVAVYDDGVAFLRAVRAAGLRTAVVSASRHCKAVLASVGLLAELDAVVDGEDSRRLRLPGKPDPASFLEAARRLAVPPADGIVLEDALAGVEAGQRGGFGLVIGVDRSGHASALRAHGAHLVVSDLRRLLPAAASPAA